MLPVPTVDDLAAFSGRGVDTYSPFAATVLEQATLLFSVITRRTEMPDDPAQASLLRYAIVEMAGRLYSEQQYADTLASPFQSETIGTYSYSKSATALQAKSGGATGLLWWDLAVDQLTLPGLSQFGSGSVGGGFEDDLGVNAGGRRGIRSVDDLEPPPYVRIS